MKSIVYLIIVGWLLILSGCSTMGGGANVHDGTWSMCKVQSKSGFMVNLPFKTALPIGAETPNGTVISCEPIPAKVEPEKTSAYNYIPDMKWNRQAKDTVKT